jgi:hypothetical protein
MTYLQNLTYCLLLFLEGMVYFLAALINVRLDLPWAFDFVLRTKDIESKVQEANQAKLAKVSQAENNLVKAKDKALKGLE